MNNTVILSTPRSGSNFLNSTLCDFSNLYTVGEFFSGGDDYNIYFRNHLKYINWYYLYNYKKDYAFKIYKRMFQVIGSDNYNVVRNRDALNEEHLALLMEFLKYKPQISWSHTLNKNVERNRVLVKVFYNHYNYENHFNISQALEMFDNLIFLYRENLLNQFISWCVAVQTKIWFSQRNHTTTISSQLKITWNLDDYMSFWQEHIKWAKEYKQHLSEFSHKKTAIIKYENINKENYKQEIEKILESNGIEHKIGYSNTKKQSIESIDTADRFINKEEFLDDYSKIEDKVLLKIEDI